MPVQSSCLRSGLFPLLLACSVALAQTPPSVSSKANTLPSRSAVSAARNQAGVIVLVDGKASLAVGGTGPRQARVGDAVSEGDLLITGKDGEVHVQMQDSGFLLLRPNSRIQIVQYRADGGEEDNEVIRLINGGLRSITGWIGKFSSHRYRLETANATIGIRGTDHETRYQPEGSPEGEAGTYDRVFAGQTYIETPTERTGIAPNQAGFISLRPRERARLLAEIPGFFRPGPHEAEINKKHAEIQRQIDQHREERRKVIAEKQAALEAARTKVQTTIERNKTASQQSQQAAQQQRAQTQARWEELQRDVKAAEELRQEIQENRKSLEADVQSGQISRPEVRKRRLALQEKEKALAAAQESNKQRRKALQEEIDERIDKRLDAAQDRQKAVHDQLLDAREQRKSLDQERESTTEELKALRQDEGKRYHEELKKDRKLGDEPAPKQ